ncbi:MAG: peptidylprolyl isomerase, partial [Pseudomonadota bacterium]
MKPNTPRTLLALLVLTFCASLQAQTLRPSGRINASPTQRIAQSGPLQADFIVAVVNSEPITNNDLRARVARMEQQLTQQGTAMPPREQLARRMLEQLINERAQLQVARETGVKADESMIDIAASTVAQQNQLDIAGLRRRLEADGIGWAQFRADLRDQLLLTRLREREVESRTRMSDQEVDQFIREQQAGGDAEATEINLAHVLITVPENATEAQIATLRARAQMVFERAQKGDDFAALATEFSSAPDRTSGGQLGMRTLDRYPALFTEATKNVAAGGVAAPVRSGAGFHVLKVLEKKLAGMPSSVRQTRARHILLRTGPKLSEAAAKERLQQLRQRVREGKADFAALAKEFSQDGSANNGGDLGWAVPGQFVPEFEEVMGKLAPDQISDPLVSRFGVHLIQVLERRDTKLTQAQQRDAARNILREKKSEEAYLLWAQEVRGRAYVEFREPP